MVHVDKIPALTLILACRCLCGSGPVQGGKLTRLMSDLMFTNNNEANITTEDTDAAPAIEVQACNKSHSSCCTMVDDAAQLLWVADKEGWVYGK